VRVRKVVITKDSNISDVESLVHSVNVKKCWRLPRGYTLFEFYHPVFERLYDSDPQVSNAARLEAFVQEQSKMAHEERRRLLAPLYKGKPWTFQPVQLFFPGVTAMTEFLGEGKVDWPEVRLPVEGWETNREAKLRVRLVIMTEDTTRELRKIIDLWGKSGIVQGEIEKVSPLSFEGREAEFSCKFQHGGRDAIMALYMLLTDTRALTSLESLEAV
jgi:hypothetical protein